MKYFFVCIHRLLRVYSSSSFSKQSFCRTLLSQDISYTSPIAQSLQAPKEGPKFAQNPPKSHPNMEVSQTKD